MYYIQHGLMVVIPYYLLRIGGVYNVEPLSDISWSIFSYGLNLAYHFWVLQIIALVHIYLDIEIYLLYMSLFRDNNRSIFLFPADTSEPQSYAVCSRFRPVRRSELSGLDANSPRNIMPIIVQTILLCIRLFLNKIPAD